MSGRFFVHIGLPKTATSTLQIDLFPAIITDAISYIGVDGLRREQYRTELYDLTLSAVKFQKDVEEVRALLAAQLNAGISLILSEEMLTVSHKATPWRQNLANLSLLLDGLDYALILTVREPVSAIFSYYVERYPYFAGRYADFTECALNDEAMQIYHYGKLLKEIDKWFARDRVFVYRFEDIIKNNGKEILKIISPAQYNTFEINLSKQNQRKRVGGFVYSRHSLTIPALIRRALLRVGIGDTKLIAILAKVVRPVTKLLDKIALRRIKVPYPSAEEMTDLRKALEQETNALTEYCGIRY